MIKLVFHPLSLYYSNDCHDDWSTGTLETTLKVFPLMMIVATKFTSNWCSSFWSGDVDCIKPDYDPLSLLKEPMQIDSHITTRLNRTRHRRHWRPHIWHPFCLIMFSCFVSVSAMDGTKHTEGFENVKWIICMFYNRSFQGIMSCLTLRIEISWKNNVK